MFATKQLLSFFIAMLFTIMILMALGFTTEEKESAMKVESSE